MMGGSGSTESGTTAPVRACVSSRVKRGRDARRAFTVAVVTLLPGGIEIDPQGEGMLAIAPLPSRVLDIPTRRKYRVRRGNWVSEPTAVGLNSVRGLRRLRCQGHVAARWCEGCTRRDKNRDVARMNEEGLNGSPRGRRFQTVRRPSVAVVGLGYWGPNLLRVLVERTDIDVRWMCDADPARLERLARRYPGVAPTLDLDDVLEDPEGDGGPL